MNYTNFNKYLKSLYITRFKDRQEIINLFKSGIRVSEARKIIEEKLGYSKITSDNILEYMIFPQKRSEFDKRLKKAVKE